jgi:hypothetical protein
MLLAFGILFRLRLQAVALLERLAGSFAGRTNGPGVNEQLSIVLANSTDGHHLPAANVIGDPWDRSVWDG